MRRFRHRLGWTTRDTDPHAHAPPYVSSLCSQSHGLALLVDADPRLGFIPRAKNVFHAVVARVLLSEIRPDTTQSVPGATLDVVDARNPLQLMKCVQRTAAAKMPSPKDS
jgi:hypothetical protein